MGQCRALVKTVMDILGFKKTGGISCPHEWLSASQEILRSTYSDKFNGEWENLSTFPGHILDTSPNKLELK
jgi:hypothetical protein